MAPLRVAQIGTRHGHAAGKMEAMLANPDCQVVGIAEGSAAERAKARGNPPYTGVRWFESIEELLADPSIEMVAVESHNDENLQHCRMVIEAGKHCWLDKPAGDDFEEWQRVSALATAKQLHIQMGYMLRFNSSWLQVVDWARSGFLGTVYKVRANMSSGMTPADSGVQNYLDTFPGGVYPHKGGLAFDLASHCLDSIVWLMGSRRPSAITSFMTNTRCAMSSVFDWRQA
jgi:predicted dehydrogenase